MKYKEKLLQGILIKRYKRFFADINFKNQIITAHCPNSGSMMGLIKRGNIVWFSRSNNPKRKLKYTLEIIKVKKNLVGINTLIANKLVLEALNLKKIKNLIAFDKIAEFPDAVTSRGTKHLNELINAKKCGDQSYILYLIQREDCKSFKIADDIDKNYKIAFNIAIKAGVKVLCYDCKISNEEIKLNDQINLIDYE